MRTDTPHPIFLKDYRPSPYLARTVDLDIRLAPKRTRVINTMAITPNPRSDETGAQLVLDGEDIELVSIAINGRPLTENEFRVTPGSLILPTPPQDPFCLRIESTCDPDTNTALSGLYLTNGIYCTQCEAQGFRRFAYALDRPDILSVYTTRIETERAEAPILLANGNPVASGTADGAGRHFAVWSDPHPKPTYLFALVAGKLARVNDRFVTASGRGVTLSIFVEPGKEDRCGWAMESLKRAMRWDEEAYGREYDLDVFMIVAVPDFNMGAMENKGLNIFNDRYILARPDTATDQDYARIESIVAHEYFHNWSGNRVTCRDWFQLCLKEGLTVFRDQEFTTETRSGPVKRIADVRTLRTVQFTEDAGPLAHPVRPASFVEINNFYTATVYQKGAELVRMMRTLLGADVFRDAMDLYFARFDGQAATVEDFVSCMEDASGRDLSRFFRWYEQAGTPCVTAQGHHDPASRTFALTLSQSTPPTPDQPDKRPLHIPLEVGLLGPNGAELPLIDEDGKALSSPLLELIETIQILRFTGIRERPVISLNRGFTAPIRLEINHRDGDLEWLMTHDSDPFNRWDAAQTIAMTRMVALAARSRHHDEPGTAADKRISTAFRAIVEDEGLTPAMKAEILTLPDDRDIASELGSDVDPAAAHAARRTFVGWLGGELMPDLLALRETIILAGRYEPDPESAGRRALRNAALALIATADGPLGARLALAQYREAGNMTDAFAALHVLALLPDAPESEEALATFLDRAGEDRLLLDKWLVLSALRPLAATIETVEALTGHSAFSWTRPNSVYSLLGAFASRNPIAFHDPSGRGYDLLAEAIIRIDRFNPQVASRLSGMFESWRILEPRRRKAVRARLVRIHAQEGLSGDVSEMMTRLLVDG